MLNPDTKIYWMRTDHTFVRLCATTLEDAVKVAVAAYTESLGEGLLFAAGDPAGSGPYGTDYDSADEFKTAAAAWLEQWFVPAVRLTDDDCNMIYYFWREKQDVTRWTGWERVKPIIARDHPQVIRALDNLAAAEKNVTDTINALRDTVGSTPP